MQELRVWFLLWLTAMTILIAIPAEGRQSGPLFAGGCGEGWPRLTRWDPSLTAEFQPICLSGQITLATALLKEPITQPSDFSAWAFLRLNGQRLLNPYHDAYPYVSASTGEAVVPLRLVTEAMTGTVTWNEAGRTITFTWRGESALLTIGSREAVRNGERIILDQAPFIWLDRTMVSPETLSTLFGTPVGFDPETNQVVIRRAGILCPLRFCTRV